MDHHRHETHAERRMGHDHGPESAGNVERDEQQQQRQAGDDLGHDQRRVDHGGEDEASPETPEAGEGYGGAGSHYGRQKRGHEGHAKAHPGGGDELVVFEKRDIPVRGEPAPDRDKPRGVEAVDHQQRDRRIEEAEAKEQRQGSGVASLAHGRASAIWLRS